MPNPTTVLLGLLSGLATALAAYMTAKLLHVSFKRKAD